jgi:simple sugar transport system ATP-binding protein
MTDPEAVPVLEVRGVQKTYGSVRALRDANFTLQRREIHALIGDNGAGKSTLIKIMSGAVTPDRGALLLDGERVLLRSPSHARDVGIETVYQDLALADTLDATKNVCLGREIRRKGLLGRLGFYDYKAMRAVAERSLAELGARVPASKAPVGGMSGGQRQAIAVARASVWGSRLLIMDEAMAALGHVQTEQVLDLVRRTKEEKGLPVILISHNMREVLRVADRVTALYLGRTVFTARTSDTTANELVAAMTGELTRQGQRRAS